jgi:dTDP-4-amino-4,6-dideoxygalactose transaminase
LASDPKLTVAKAPSDTAVAQRTTYEFNRARDGIGAFFDSAGLTSGAVVLCPAYVGWSPNEGSGILDPLQERGFDVHFYRLGPDLGIDLAHLRDELRGGEVAGLIVVPFFGRIPDGYAQAIELGREFGAWTLEDEAHSLLTDLTEGTSGRAGHGAVFSLHKFFPLPDGGLLLINRDETSERNWTRRPEFADLPHPEGRARTLVNYDLAAIATARKANAQLLMDLLREVEGEIDPLWPELREGEVLQTLPTVVQQADRDQIYESMNKSGFGVTSLYHSLVRNITPEEFPDSHWLSKHILNLPIHQDASAAALEQLVSQLVVTLRQRSG